jgi:methyltransferase (TIGR00027 family)
MADIDSGINHISDTALWVAVYRAVETERKDALFRDPYASILAGERGKRIVENMYQGQNSAWSMIVRTVVLDEFVTQTIAHDNIDTVINLAAGLDTRPYRLDLPPSLNWIEVDLPGIMGYKEQKLVDAKPHCRVERIRLDLTNRDERKKLFERISRDAERVLVISEGLLVYLTEEDVSALASDLYDQSNFYWWMMDLLTPELLDWLLKNTFKRFASGDVQMHFAPKGGANFFHSYGWATSESRLVSKEARRLKREMPKAWLFRLLSPLASKKQKEFYSKLDSYFVLLNRDKVNEP